MKRYDFTSDDICHSGCRMEEFNDGEYIKLEDVKPPLTLDEIEVLDDIIGMYRQEFGAADYRYVKAEKIIEKLRGKR